MEGLSPLHWRVAGIDVHRMRHVVTVLIEQPDGSIRKHCREFGGFKRDSRALATWLAELQVQRVVMESTGIYWKSVYHRPDTQDDSVDLHPAQPTPALSRPEHRLRRHQREEERATLDDQATPGHRQVAQPQPSSGQRRTLIRRGIPGVGPSSCSNNAACRQAWSRHFSDGLSR